MFNCVSVTIANSIQLIRCFPSQWPTPLHYRARPILGPRQKTMLEPPSFTIGTRKDVGFNKRGKLVS